MTVERASKLLGAASAERAEPVRSGAWLGRIGESQKTWWRAGEVPVWEHVSGIRIHIHGLIRFTDGTHCTPEYDLPRWRRAMAVVGGKKRRALMAWAEMLMRHNDESSDLRPVSVRNEEQREPQVRCDEWLGEPNKSGAADAENGGGGS